MIQVFCPACENVVWVDGAADGDCPECSNPLHLVGRRKSRPPLDPDQVPAVDTRLTPGPAAETRRKASVPEEEPAPVPSADDVLIESGFGVPWTEPQTRYVPLPYRPDGGVSPARFPFYVASLLAAGAALGWVASTVGQFYYFILLFPLGVGIGLAGFAVLAGQLARVRSPVLGGLAGLAAACAAVAAMHFCDYLYTARLLRTQPDRVGAELRRRLGAGAGFLDYLEATARVGLTVSGGDDPGFNLGYEGTLAYWGLELAVIGGLVLFGTRYGAAEPYCTECDGWKDEREVGTLREGDGLLRVLRQGNLGGLVEHRSARQGGELRLWLAVCPRCGQGAPVDLRVERREARRGRPAGEVAHLTYPGEAMGALQEIFVEPARAVH